MRLYNVLDFVICLLNREMKERQLLRQRAKAHQLYIIKRDFICDMQEMREEAISFFSIGIVDDRVDYQTHLMHDEYRRSLIKTIELSINSYRLMRQQIEQKYRKWLTPRQLQFDLMGI